MTNRRRKLCIPSSYLLRLVLAPMFFLILLINLIIIAGMLSATPRISELMTPYTGVIIGLIEILALSIAFLFLIITSHRLAGPLHALEKQFERIGEGDLSGELKLRKHDHHQQLEAAYNANLRQLKTRLQAQQELSRELLDTIDDAKALEAKALDLHRQLMTIKTDPDDNEKDAKEPDRLP